jgi:hypothetical protein
VVAKPAPIHALIQKISNMLDNLDEKARLGELP